MHIDIHSEEAMKKFGQAIGQVLSGGETIELVGDVGAGKTTFTKGLALGMNILEPIQSPTFTISRVYETPQGLKLAHYDFYRLSEPGVMADELMEVVHDTNTVTVIEWAGIVEGVLPKQRTHIEFISPTESSRRCTIQTDNPVILALLKEQHDSTH